MAIASSYQARLVLSASVDQDHPFSLKFQLFGNGRLPIGIIEILFQFLNIMKLAHGILIVLESELIGN